MLRWTPGGSVADSVFPVQGAWGLIPVQGARSHKPQLKEPAHMQLKLPNAAAKIKKNFF